MKTKLSAVLLGAGLLAGCVVDSEQPFYRPADLAFDEKLLGEWREPAKPGEPTGELIRIERAQAQSYRIRVPGGDGKEEVLELRLFKLGGQTFGDHLTRPDDGSPARHQLMRIEKSDGGWKFSALNYGWVRDHLRANPKALAHRFAAADGNNKENPPVTLTATTAELQAFVLKHRAEAGFFAEPTMLERAPAAPGKAAK